MTSLLRASCLLPFVLGAACSGGGSDAPSSDDAASDDAGAQSDAASSDGADVTPPAVPTISSYLGTNVSGDLTDVDLVHVLAPFDTPAASKDAHGLPVAGASGKSTTDVGFLLPTGDYTLSYRGDGAVAVSGVGTLSGAFTTTGDVHHAKVHVTHTPHEFGHLLTLTITNGAGQTVSDLHLRMPGFDYDAKDVFLPQFLALLKPFRALRFMDWEHTNGSNVVHWSDRPQEDVFGSSPDGVSWEHIVELINVTGKDAWITIPEHVDDDYVTQLAQFLGAHLDFARIDAARTAQGFGTPFRLMVENSNETWNGGFTAFKTFLTEAQKDPTRYDAKYTGSYGPSWMAGNADLLRVGQYEADRLVQIAKIFRAQLGPKADMVAPVLSGWALGAVYSDVGLRFIRDHYGDPKTFITHVALAPYFTVDDAKTGSLADLFPALTAAIDDAKPQLADFAKLGAEWGLTIAAYEGGQGISGSANLNVKHLAQHDARMHDAYLHAFDTWHAALGDALFMHFTLAGSPDIPESFFQYGFWGSMQSVMEDPTTCTKDLPTLTGSESLDSVVHHCPKYAALLEQLPK